MSIFRVRGCYRVGCQSGQDCGEVRFCMAVVAECEKTAVQMAAEKLLTGLDCKRFSWESVKPGLGSADCEMVKLLRIGRYLAFGFDSLDGDFSAAFIEAVDEE